MGRSDFRCWWTKALSSLKTIVADCGDNFSPKKRRQSPVFSAKVAEFGDYGQAIRRCLVGFRRHIGDYDTVKPCPHWRL